jgi:hypothetical protein
MFQKLALLPLSSETIQPIISFKSPDIWQEPIISYSGVASTCMLQSSSLTGHLKREREEEKDINVCILLDELNEHA